MSLFSAKEIFQTAINMEINGEKFYKQLTERIQDHYAKDMFGFLAKEEEAHKKIFENMLNQIHDISETKTFYGEYFAYLHSYVDSNIFSFDKLKKEIDKLKEIVSAIDFAIRRELDSIAYYQEIKIWVPAKDHSIIDTIIDEERKHFVKLIGFKKKLYK